MQVTRPRYLPSRTWRNGKRSASLFVFARLIISRYCDYFQALYQCIEARLKGELASRWEDAKIEFIFSVPTTWKPNPTVERFRSIIKRAGFGRSPNHAAVIGLTEAEAAAVHTARNTPAIFNVRLDVRNVISALIPDRRTIYYLSATWEGARPYVYLGILSL